MQKFYFSLPNKLILSLATTLDFTFDTKAELLLKAYVPGIQFIKNNKNKKSTILVNHIQSAKKKFVQKGNTYTIYDMWKNEFPLDLYHLLYSITRVYFLKKNLYPVHAACINNTLLVGHSGVGKTSLVLSLLNHGYKLFSGNKTVVSFNKKKIEGIAGTPTITLNTNDSKNQTYLTKTEKIIYGNRVAGLPDPKYFNTAKNTFIKKIVIAKLNDGAEEYEKLNKDSALHTLYGYFLDTVNADTIVCNGKGIFLGNPPKGSREKLVKYLKETLVTIPVYKITGSRIYVTKKITTL